MQHCQLPRVGASRYDRVRSGDPGHVDDIRQGDTGGVSRLRVMPAAQRRPARLTDRNETVAEIEDTDPVVARTAEVEQRTGVDVLRVAAPADLLHGVSRDDRVADDQVLGGVCIADCRRDTTGEIAPAQAVGARHTADFVLDDRAVLDLEVTVRHVDATTAPVAHRQQEPWQARRGLGEIPRDRAVRQLQRIPVADAATVRVHTGPVGEQAADPVAADG